MSKSYSQRNLGSDFNKHVALSMSQTTINNQRCQIIGTSAPVIISKLGKTQHRHAIGVVGGIKEIDVHSKLTAVLTLLGELTVVQSRFLASSIDFIPTPAANIPSMEFEEIHSNEIKIADVDALFVWALSRCGKIVANIYLESESDAADTIPGFILDPSVPAATSFSVNEKCEFILGDFRGSVHIIDFKNLKQEMDDTFADRPEQVHTLKFEDSLLDFETRKISIKVSSELIVKCGFLSEKTAYAIDSDNKIFFIDIASEAVVASYNVHKDRITTVRTAFDVLISCDLNGLITASNEHKLISTNTYVEAVDMKTQKDLVSILSYDGTVINKEYPKDFN